MALLESFLSVETRSDEKCFLCEKTIEGTDKSVCISESSWDNFKEIARDWSKINVNPDDDLFHFTQTYVQIKDKLKPIGKLHQNCRIKFKTRIKRYKKKYDEKQNYDIEEESHNVEISVEHSSKARKSNRGSVSKSLCFICQEKRVGDDNP